MREVSEADASGEAARLYEQIRAALGSPNVNLIYRLLASYPTYLSAAWRQIGPNVASRYLERDAERLRAMAACDVGGAAGSLARVSTSLGVSDRELVQIRGVVDLFNYANPKNLIAITALLMALDGRAIAGTRDAEDGRPVPSRPLPDVEVRMLDPEAASPEVRALLAEIVEAHGTDGVVPSVYRALATWPSFLRATWQAVGPCVRGTEFDHRVRLLATEAERSALGLPHPVDLSENEAERLVGAVAVGAIRATLEMFRTEMISAMTVEIHTLKALLDGQDAASPSPFAWRPRVEDR